MDEQASSLAGSEGSLQPGTELGEFRLIELIGRGSFGEVYRAHQERWRRDVAVKVMLAGANKHVHDLSQRFVREIDVIRRLQHPNVVQLYDFGQSEEGHLWMAMELVQGPTLAGVLNIEAKLSASRARHICLQLLSGLIDAHRASIVHRDIKPANIMLTRMGAEREWVKILDFGVGKVINEKGSRVQDLTQEGYGGFGTPRYMAPEQIQLEEVGAHTDVYAAGLILYEMLVGQPAIKGNNSYDMLVQHLNDGIQQPSWLAHTTLGQVLAKATTRHWEERYPSALEFYEALDALSENELMQPSPEATQDEETEQTIRVSLDSLAQRLAPVQSSSSESLELEPRDTQESPAIPPSAEYLPAPNPLQQSLPRAAGARRPSRLLLGMGLFLLFAALSGLAWYAYQRQHTPATAAAPTPEAPPKPDVTKLSESLRAPPQAVAEPELAPPQRALLEHVGDWVEERLPPVRADQSRLLRWAELVRTLLRQGFEQLFDALPANTANPTQAGKGARKRLQGL
ncbi:MAG: serine/threonine-protein kinase [Myxococcota bacterium]|nr:serine/threonine-protein kinase [Myxococcota bacterium]